MEKELKTGFMKCSISLKLRGNLEGKERKLQSKQEELVQSPI